MSNYLPDDNGIKADQVIDICDFVISRCWEEIFGEDVVQEDLNVQKLEYLMKTASEAFLKAAEVIVAGDKIGEITECDGQEIYDEEEEEENF